MYSQRDPRHSISYLLAPGSPALAPHPLSNVNHSHSSGYPATPHFIDPPRCIGWTDPDRSEDSERSAQTARIQAAHAQIVRAQFAALSSPRGPTGFVSMPIPLPEEPSSCFHVRRNPIDFNVVGSSDPGVLLPAISPQLQVERATEPLFGPGSGCSSTQVHINWKVPGYPGSARGGRLTMNTKQEPVNRLMLLHKIRDRIQLFFDVHGAKYNLCDPDNYNGDPRWHIGRNPNFTPNHIVVTRLIHLGDHSWSPEIWIRA